MDTGPDRPPSSSGIVADDPGTRDRTRMGPGGCPSRRSRPRMHVDAGSGPGHAHGDVGGPPTPVREHPGRRPLTRRAAGVVVRVSADVCRHGLAPSVCPVENLSGA